MNTSTFYSAAHALQRYRDFHIATDLIKDGKQQVSLAIDLTFSLIHTSFQFNRLNPPFRPWICVLPTLALPIACTMKSHLEIEIEKQKDWPSCCKKDYSAYIKTGEYAELLAQHSDKILFAATLTSSVVLAALGFPVEGGIIFASLLLSIAKKLKCIPAPVDHSLSYLNNYFAFIESFLAPTSLSYKIPDLLILLLLNLEKFIELNPAPKAIEKNDPQDMKTILEIIDNNKPWSTKLTSFKVNPSYIFAEEAGQIVSQEVLEELNKKTHQQWFSELKAHIESEKIILTPAEIKGLSNLEECINTGTFEGKVPTNLEGFYLQIKMICYRILNDEAHDVESTKENDEANSKKKDETNSCELIKEFAKLGNSCTEGWTREISFYSTSKSNDYKWSIHNHLSKWRGALLNEGIRTVGKLILEEKRENETRIREITRRGDYEAPQPQFNNATNPPTEAFKLEGGSNNVHLLNVVHRLAWSQLRTYESECNRATNPFTTIEILVFRYCSDIKSTIFKWYSTIFASANLSSLNADLILKAMDSPIKQSQRTPNIVNQIYNALKPEITIAKDKKAESSSKIPRQLIWGWARDIETRYPELDMADPKWYEISDDGKYHLSQKGVLLLLWDMNIIKLSTPPAQEGPLQPFE